MSSGYFQNVFPKFLLIKCVKFSSVRLFSQNIKLACKNTQAVQKPHLGPPSMCTEQLLHIPCTVHIFIADAAARNQNVLKLLCAS